jgi:hypothetical protein
MEAGPILGGHSGSPLGLPVEALGNIKGSKGGCSAFSFGLSQARMHDLGKTAFFFNIYKRQGKRRREKKKGKKNEADLI